MSFWSAEQGSLQTLQILLKYRYALFSVFMCVLVPVRFLSYGLGLLDMGHWMNEKWMNEKMLACFSPYVATESTDPNDIFRVEAYAHTKGSAPVCRIWSWSATVNWYKSPQISKFGQNCGKLISGREGAIEGMRITRTSRNHRSTVAYCWLYCQIKPPSPISIRRRLTSIDGVLGTWIWHAAGFADARHCLRFLFTIKRNHFR